MQTQPKVLAIDALLPQTQCTRCGYQGCLPYAQAIAAGEANINQCPPGGAATIDALAALTGLPVLALNPLNGVEKPREVAYILEEHCIGCTKCLPACPVDAILGANKRMHTVIAVECTGCELCIAPCPVDCIVMLPDTALTGSGRGPISAIEATHFKRRFDGQSNEARHNRPKSRPNAKIYCNKVERPRWLTPSRALKRGAWAGSRCPELLSKCACV